MSNVPPGDTGLVMVPHAVAWSEWTVRLAGQIATCVEVSEMVVSHLVELGFPLSDAEDMALANDLIARGEASANGATNWAAASAQMARNGIPNIAYGPSSFPANWVALCQDAIRRGIPVLFGVYAAHNLHDDWTNSGQDAGVDGHAIALVGFDATGAIVADPNTQQATVGNFVHYSWANLAAAGGGSPSMVIPLGAVNMATVLDSYFAISSDGQTYVLKSNAKITLGGGELELFRRLGGATGLPKTEMNYGLQGRFGETGLCFRVYERAIVVYDPGHKKDAQPGFGDFYLGHIDDPDYGIAVPPVPPVPPAPTIDLAGIRADIKSATALLVDISGKLPAGL